MSLVGKPAPQLRLIDTQTEYVSLEQFSGQKVILAFYPAAFSGICDTEMCTFRDQIARLNAAQVAVIGISPDSPFANKKFAEVYGINFPLLSDLHLDAARAYGVVFENFAFVEGYTACNRAVFIIDESGLISFQWAGEHPGIEPDYDAVLKAAGA